MPPSLPSWALVSCKSSLQRACSGARYVRMYGARPSASVPQMIAQRRRRPANCLGIQCRIIDPESRAKCDRSRMVGDKRRAMTDGSLGRRIKT